MKLYYDVKNSTVEMDLRVFPLANKLSYIKGIVKL